MFLPDNDNQILKLSNDFYEAYPNPPYTEILEKRNRSYNCLLFQTHYDYFICIPYRSNVNHRSAYRFRFSERSRRMKSGLDYSKMVIIKNLSYLDNTKSATIDQDEFNETMRNLNRIKSESLQFLEDYIKYKKGELILHSGEYRRRYEYSTLQYFHDILEIEENE